MSNNGDLVTSPCYWLASQAQCCGIGATPASYPSCQYDPAKSVNASMKTTTGPITLNYLCEPKFTGNTGGAQLCPLATEMATDPTEHLKLQALGAAGLIFFIAILAIGFFCYMKCSKKVSEKINNIKKKWKKEAKNSNSKASLAYLCFRGYLVVYTLTALAIQGFGFLIPRWRRTDNGNACVPFFHAMNLYFLSHQEDFIAGPWYRWHKTEAQAMISLRGTSCDYFSSQGSLGNSSIDTLPSSFQSLCPASSPDSCCAILFADVTTIHYVAFAAFALEMIRAIAEIIAMRYVYSEPRRIAELFVPQGTLSKALYAFSSEGVGSFWVMYQASMHPRFLLSSAGEMSLVFAIPSMFADLVSGLFLPAVSIYRCRGSDALFHWELVLLSIFKLFKVAVSVQSLVSTKLCGGGSESENKKKKADDERASLLGDKENDDRRQSLNETKPTAAGADDDPDDDVEKSQRFFQPLLSKQSQRSTTIPDHIKKIANFWPLNTARKNHQKFIPWGTAFFVACGCAFVQISPEAFQMTSPYVMPAVGLGCMLVGMFIGFKYGRVFDIVELDLEAGVYIAREFYTPFPFVSQTRPLWACTVTSPQLQAVGEDSTRSYVSMSAQVDAETIELVYSFLPGEVNARLDWMLTVHQYMTKEGRGFDEDDPSLNRIAPLGAQPPAVPPLIPPPLPPMQGPGGYPQVPHGPMQPAGNQPPSLGQGGYPPAPYPPPPQPYGGGGGVYPPPQGYPGYPPPQQLQQGYPYGAPPQQQQYSSTSV